LPGLAGFVGEFLVLLGAVDYQAILGFASAFTIVFAAVYLLFMVQNTIFGELSDFLKGLGSRLTDVDRVEAMTLAPLVVLTVVLGLVPALVLDLTAGPVEGILGIVTGAADAAVGAAAAAGQQAAQAAVAIPAVALP
jgi:NADH-quinone oxidoreductase subunit M